MRKKTDCPVRGRRGGYKRNHFLSGLARKLCAAAVIAAVSSAVFAAPKLSDFKKAIDKIEKAEKEVEKAGKKIKKVEKKIEKAKDISEQQNQTASQPNRPKASQKMIDAVRADRDAEVKQLLQDGEDPNSVSYNGTEPLLSVAATMGAAKAMKVLLDAGADAKATFGAVQMTALHSAVNTSKSSPAVVKLLIAAGADVNATLKPKAGEGNSVLMEACKNSSPEVVKLLVDAGADVNYKTKQYSETALSKAVQPTRPAVSLSIAKILVGAGAQVNDGWSLKNCIQYTELNDVTKLLIASGADVNAVIGNKNSPNSTYLIEAARNENLGAVKLLVQAKADVNGRDGDSNTALHILSTREYANTSSYAGNTRYKNITETVRFLIKSGADADSKNQKGETPLMLAAQYGCGDVCKALIDGGAKVNARDKGGRTALWYAKNNVSDRNTSGSLKVLMQHGATL